MKIRRYRLLGREITWRFSEARRNPDCLARNWIIGPVLTTALAMAVILSASATAMAEPVVTDGNTAFHRVYILGSGDSSEEDTALSDDFNALRADLGRSGNHKSLNSITFIRPSKAMLQWVLDSVKSNAQPGDAVTFYFSGRGNVDTIRLRSGDNVSASELATMLSGFMDGVSRVIILDSCFGGSFADDIGESGQVAVIGTSTTCPFDAPFDGFTETFSEDIAALAGLGGADANSDQAVTAAELKTKLEDHGWKLGEALSGDTIMEGKSKCDGACSLPTIAVTPPECADPLDISGERFASSSPIAIEVLDSGLATIADSSTTSAADGTFSSAVAGLDFPSLVVAMDGSGNRDWHFCATGGDVPVVDDTAPACQLTSGDGVIEGTIQDTESGLADIEVSSAWNVTVDVPAFAFGTTDPVVILATIINTSRSAQVRLRAVDVAGNITICKKYVRRIRIRRRR